MLAKRLRFVLLHMLFYDRDARCILEILAGITLLKHADNGVVQKRGNNIYLAYLLVVSGFFAILV